MAKDKFDALNGLDEVTKDAALQEQEAKENETVDFLIKKFPKDLSDKLMKRKNIESRVSFVKRAAMKLAAEEGLI